MFSLHFWTWSQLTHLVTAVCRFRGEILSFPKDSNADYVVKMDLCQVTKKKKSARFPPALCTLLYTVYCNLGGSCHIEFSHYPVYTAGLTLQTEYTGWDWTISHTHTHTSLIYEFKLIFKLMVKTEGGLRYVFLQTGPLWWVCCLPTVKHCWPLMACETAEKEKQHRAEKQGRWAGKVSIKGFKSLKALSRTTWDV